MLCGVRELHLSMGCVGLDVSREQRGCDMPLPGEADVEEMQLEACFPRQGSNSGTREMDAGGALGHQVSCIHSSREPPVLPSLILRESDPTLALSKMVLFAQIQQVMTLGIKSRHFNSYDPKLIDEGFFLSIKQLCLCHVTGDKESATNSC